MYARTLAIPSAELHAAVHAIKSSVQSWHRNKRAGRKTGVKVPASTTGLEGVCVAVFLHISCTPRAAFLWWFHWRVVPGCPREPRSSIPVMTNAPISPATPAPTAAGTAARGIPPSVNPPTSSDERPPTDSASAAPSRPGWSRPPPPIGVGGSPTEPPCATRAAHDAPISPATPAPTAAVTAARGVPPSGGPLTSSGERPSTDAASAAPSERGWSRPPPPTRVGGSPTGPPSHRAQPQPYVTCRPRQQRQRRPPP